METALKLNIRDEVFAELKELAERDGISINCICNYAITDFISSYAKEIKPLPKANISESAKDDPEFFASLYENLLNEKRMKKVRKAGSIIKL